ncbi:MAG: amidohydrolase family protein [Gemmatimonadota bacterium]|nr:amidohydrolase family protein [Gemmatimonadota bacterium]
MVRPIRWVVALAALTLSVPVLGQDITLPELIPMGTTVGQTANRVLIRGATVISGRGSPRSNRAMPPEGPIDILIENGRIVDMVLRDPVNMAGGTAELDDMGADLILDGTGKYVIPGLVDMHVHIRENGGDMGPRALDYQYRLWMGHGITTVRDAGTGASLEVMTGQRELSNRHEVVAPRLVLCQRWPLPLRRWDVGNTPESARQMVREFHEKGADCIKISKSPGHYPDVLAAAVDEGRALGMQTMVDLKISETDAVTASEAGVTSIEHWYGVPDAALDGSQDLPTDYNYWDELDRFRWAGDLWRQADPDKLSEVMDILIANGTNWDPTMVVYEDNRDLWRAVTLPWVRTLYHPSTVEAMWPDEASHGAFKREWKTSDEVMWKNNYRIWMDWVREFHARGGLLTVGSDTSPWGGMAVIREMELMQEAGIHPIDVIRVATTNAYQTLGMEDHCGIRVGCAADLAVVNGNPIDNLKVMYGLGYGFYGIAPPDEQWEWGGVTWTIKDGVVYDARALLQEALWYVQQEKSRAISEEGG